MSSPNVGLFTWYELLTSDVEGAKAFYGAVVGWGTQAWDNPAMKYTMWTGADGPVGGLMSLADAQAEGAPPHWMGTVSVDDVDATVARAVELGGTVVAPANDIPGVGRFAMIADPTGAVLSLLQPADPGPPIDVLGPRPFVWSELWTSDPAAAWTFLSALFGWVEAGTMDMGEMGTYRMFGRTADKMFGGIAMKAPDMPVSAWMHYAHVDDADSACNRARELGAHVFMGPMDIPGGGRVFGAVDPQGATFAVHSRAETAS